MKAGARFPHLIWPFLAGICHTAGYFHLGADLSWLSVFFFPFLLLSLHSLRDGKSALGHGLLVSAAIALSGYHWISYASQKIGSLPWSAAGGILGVYCLICSPQMPAFLLVGRRLLPFVERLPAACRALFWSCLYIVLDYLLHFVRIFPEELAHPLIHYPPLAQAASVGGLPLLSFLPVFLGATLFYLGRCGAKAWPAAVACALLILGFWRWGEAQIERYHQAPARTLRLGLIQPNHDGEAYRNSDLVLDELLATTEWLAKEKPDLIVWPETAYPRLFPGRPQDFLKGPGAQSDAKRLRATVGRTKVPLLFGALELDPTGQYNSAILLNGAGEPVSSYRKVHLFFFGEYDPLVEWLPVLERLRVRGGTFSRGEGPVPLALKVGSQDLKAGVAICYESILPEFMRDLARRGADLFVNISSDSAFGDTFEPWEHFQLSAIHAVAHQRPLVVVTTTGISGVVLPTGETRILTPPFRRAAEIVDVPVPAQVITTLYTQYGDWFVALAMLVVCGLGGWARKRTQKRKSADPREGRPILETR